MHNRLDAIAKEYENDSLNFESYYRLKIILEHIKGENVLNLGIGDGIIVNHLIDQCKYVDTVDASGEIIKKYISSYGVRKGLRLFENYFEDFSPDKKYDEIVMSNILEHVDDERLIIKKSRDWLSDEGQLHVVVPNGKSLHRLLGIEMGFLKAPLEITERDISWGHKRVFVKETLEEAIAGQGLKIVKSCGVFLKPLTTPQLSSFPKELLEGLYRLGFKFQEYCGYLYILCRM